MKAKNGFNACKNINNFKYMLSAILFFMFALTACSILDSDINVPGDFSTIQDAIDAASDGDIIIVEPGTYYEQIDFMGKNIVVQSINPEDPQVVAETSIDGRNRRSVVVFQNGETSDAVLRGFTITNGAGTIAYFDRVLDDEEFTVDGTYGGGILIADGSSPIIEYNIIKGNRVEIDGGGIVVFEGSNPLIRNNTIESNQALNGGGISVWSSNPIIENNLIRQNISRDVGAGISIYAGSSTRVSDNEIVYNMAGEGGGGLFIIDSDPLVSNNTIINNSAYFYGGGIFVVNASPTIDNNTISRNRSTGVGGGISLFAEASASIINNLINENFAQDNGGGIAVLNSHDLLIADNNIFSNVVDSGGGGIFVSESSPVIENNIISGHRVMQDGGGIAIMDNSDVSVLRNTLEDNRSGRYGGGILVGNDSTVIIQQNDFTNNRGVIGGAIFCLSSDISVLDNLFYNNMASRANRPIPDLIDGFEGSGAAIAVIDSLANVSRNIIDSNKAVQYGGGLFAFLNAVITMLENDFISNYADTGGAFFGLDITIDTGDPDENSYEGNMPEDVDPEDMELPDFDLELEDEMELDDLVDDEETEQ